MAPTVQPTRGENAAIPARIQARVARRPVPQAQRTPAAVDVGQSAAQARSARLPWHDDFSAQSAVPRPIAPAQRQPNQPRPAPRLRVDDEFPIDSRRAVSADPRLQQRSPTLSKYNDALNQVRDEINQAMTPMQRHFARALTMIGVVGSAGGAAVMGLYAMTALAGVASGIGAPVAGLAVAAAVLTFLGGVVLTVLVSAMMRAIVRRSVQNVPGLDKKIETLQLMRRDLRDIKKRTPAEKALLHNLDVILGKVEEANNHVASQAKVALKTIGTVLTGGLLALLAGVEQGSSKESNRPISGGRKLRQDASGAINLPDGRAQMQVLVKSMPR